MQISKPNIIQTVLPNGQIGITIDDGSNPDGFTQELKDFNYERSEIPLELINQCEKLFEETGEIHFIFDTEITNFIKIKEEPNKEEKRDISISQIFGDKYHIGTEEVFSQTLPSRFSYYDTETKLCDRYQRYKSVTNFLEKIGFTKDENSLGPEFEQSFIFILTEENYNYKSIIRLKPNLFIDLHLCFADNEGKGEIGIFYKGFFNKTKIIKSLEKNCPLIYKSILRDYKLNEVLGKNI